MKKYIISCCLILLLILSSCTGKSMEASLLPTKEGIAPVTLSERENQIINLLDKGNSAFFAMKAPKESKRLQILLHTLKEDGTWDTTQTNNDMFRGEDSSDVQPLEGVFSLTRNDDCSIAMRCENKNGVTTLLNDIPAPQLSFDSNSGSSSFLWHFQSIELDKEIPIAILALNQNNRITPPSLRDYYDTSKLADYDFVQVVTFTFTTDTNKEASQIKGE